MQLNPHLHLLSIAIEFLDNSGVLHRDISVYNIILVKKGDSKLRIGYLIDYDYAIRNDAPEEREVTKGRRTVSKEAALCRDEV